MSVYQCEHCQFITMNKSDYNKHIHTMKHLSRIPEQEPIVPVIDVEERAKDAKLFLCSHCNKAYKSKNGLQYHSKKCICGAIVDISNEIIPIDISFLEIHEPVLSGKAGHSCENVKIVGRVTASFDDIPVPFSRINSIVCDQQKKNDDDDECEYVDEAYNMGVILDLLPEANENMTELILYSGATAVVCFAAYVVFTHFFYYIPV